MDAPTPGDPHIAHHPCPGWWVITWPSGKQTECGMTFARVSDLFLNPPVSKHNALVPVD